MLKRHILLALFTALVITLFADNQKTPGHDEAVYGQKLAYSKIDSVGPCNDAAVVGKQLYAIGQGNLYILDLTQPLKPQLMGTLSGLGTTRQLMIKDSIAYITARQDGLWLVDIKNPARPELISHYDTVEMATGIWVSGGLAFIATRCYGVETVDVSDPLHPRHVSMLKTGEAQSCWARDGLLYIGDWAPKEILITDMKDPRHPQIIGRAPLDGFGDGGCLRGNICYAATGHHSRNPDKEKANGNGHGLELFDISDPTKPVFLSRVKFPTLFNIFNDMWCARVAGSHCVVSDTHNGLFVVKIDDPAQPVIVAHAQLPFPPDKEFADPVGGIALAQDVIYAAGISTGLYVIPAPGLASPVIPEPDAAPNLPPLPKTAPADPDFVIYRPEGQVSAVDVQGDIAWTACGNAGIHAVRLGNQLQHVAVHPGQGDVAYVNCVSNLLYSAESKAGMAIYEIGPDYKLTERGRLTMPGLGVKQVVIPEPGHFALIHCGGATAYVIDVRDITKPQMVLKDSQVGLFYGDQLVDKLFDDRYLAAHWHRSGPAWYDISGARPVLAGNTPDTRRYGWTDGACAFGESLLITKNGRLYVLQPNEQRNASDLPGYGIKGLHLGGRPSTDGTHLAIASRHMQTVVTLDITDITHPQLKRKYKLTGHPGACGFWKGRTLIPAGYQGLLLER